MSSCIFCEIVCGTAPAWRLYEDDRTVAFLDIHPATRGHALVIPRRHADDLFTISAEDAAAVATTVHRLAPTLEERLGCDGLNVVQANRAAAWQSVFHYHVHMVPRYVGDGLLMPWRPSALHADDLDEVQSQILRLPGS